MNLNIEQGSALLIGMAIVLLFLMVVYILWDIRSGR